MGTDLEKHEFEAMEGWIGPCFKKLHALEDGGSAELTADEAGYLASALATIEHLATYSAGYAQWVSYQMLERGKKQDVSLSVPMF